MKRAVIIVVPIILLLILIFFFGYRVYVNSFEIFQEDGHILVETSNSSITRYYFKSGTKYKNTNSNKIVFTDTNDKEVKIDTDSFVHYNNGAISTMKKAVILDLSTLSGSVFKYYSIYDGTLLTKANGYYNVKNQNSNIPFKSFLLKISKDKYLFVADSMTLTIGDENHEIKDNYLEISFFDGNITRIENQELSFSNVSSNMYLQIGDVTLDLNNRNLYYNQENKLNLNEITIDSDDAIEIPKDAENSDMDLALGKEDADEDGTGGTGSASEDSSIPNNPFEGIHNGVIDTDVNTTEEIVEENARLKDPEFTVSNLEVSPYMLRAEISIEDTENLLSGDINIKIIEADTNKIVYEHKELSGTSVLQVENQSLTPDTNYILVVNSDYVKNEVTYNKDFVQKTFVTGTIGVTIEKEYATSSSLAFNLNKSSYSTVQSVHVRLLNGSKIISEQEVSLDTVGNTEVLFTDLDNNTKYQVVVDNFVYTNSVVTDSLTITADAKTLKLKPTYGLPTFVINKKNAEFELSLNNISDPDNGITNYRYEVYDARTISDNNSQPIKVVDKNSKGSVSVSIDNDVISRGIPYAFKVVLTFDDNDKVYEYETDFSEVMKMDGVEFPSIRFEETEITFERIVGNIIINDSGNTINLDDGSLITITYQDSVGNVNTITTSGNLRIPFSVNNLRSNETYTISVYANVDLQDGNPAIDNCYVGSVIVKTVDPDSFTLKWTVDDSDISKAFSIDAQLSSADGVDTSLEASTLTGINFNLYSGTTTSGALVKSVKKVDRDLQYYSSELQSEYYDNSFEISPSLFGLRNQDLSSSYYTIEVTGAYDYTNYQNELPIVNNVITVKTNGFVPDVPSDTTSAIETNVIRNRDAGDRYREDLDPDTIVGYRIIAGYDNSKKYAKTITYQLHDAYTDEVIDTQVDTITGDGELHYMTFWLKDGTAYHVDDTSFCRGNSYYFTYTAQLDLNFDGEAETNYPTGDVVLSSSWISPKKQEPKFKLYPSTSKDNTMLWKYTYSDVDSAVVDNKLYYRMGSSEIGFVDIYKTSDKYGSFKLTSLSNGFLSIYAKEALIKTEDNLTDAVKVEQYHENEYTPNVGTYHLSLETNRLLISFLDYESNSSFYNRVTSANVTFMVGKEQIVKKNLSLYNGIIVVDLADLEDFIGRDINVSVSLLYDSGLAGFDFEDDNVALQSIQTKNQESYYYTLNEKGNLDISTSASGSLFNVDFNLEDEKLSILDVIDNENKELKLSIDEQGVSYNYEYFMPKQLKDVRVSSDGTDSFSFDMIIPGVSLMNEQGSLNISASLVDARVKMKIYGIASSTIKNELIYLDVYELDEENVDSTFVKTVEVSMNDLDEAITIDGLKPGTDYYFKVCAEVSNGDSYVRTQLYDIDSQSNTRNYYFQTLNEIGVDELKVYYGSTSYKQKYLTLSYELSEVLGYDRLEYKIYKIIEPEDGEGEPSYELVDLDIEDDKVFKEKMTKRIPISLDCGIEAGEQYLITIQPYVTLELDGEKTEIPLEREGNAVYEFPVLYSPNISITSVIYSNLSINLRVNVLDRQKTVVDGKYQVQLLNSDGEDITPEKYKNQNYDISTINNSFTLEELEQGKSYTFRVVYQLDKYNSSSKITQGVKTYRFVTTGSDINIGDVYAQTNLEDQTKINLQFYNSYKLTTIDTIRYSIYDSNSYSIDSSMEFSPSLATTSDVSYYTLTLPETVPGYGIYYLQIQFIKDDVVVAEESIEYRYTN